MKFFARVLHEQRPLHSNQLVGTVSSPIEHVLIVSLQGHTVFYIFQLTHLHISVNVRLLVVFVYFMIVFERVDVSTYCGW